ncbi:MAG: hypothetical protein WC515_01865 [Candidatus Omnitrophota bacterium]
MREVMFKELTSIPSRVKNISLKEIFERDGVVARTERRSFYYIKEITRLSEATNFKKWMEVQNHGGEIRRRQFHVLKEHNEGHGLDKVICKISGTFYAVADNKIFTIAFMNSFKVSFTRVSLPK